MKISNYIFLFFLSFLSIAIIPLFIPNGGIGADSIDYFRLAEDFPKVKWSLFPLGYPLVLKFFYFFTNDYFWAGRVANVAVFLFLGLFSYYKKFHFKETVILLCTKIILCTFFGTASETIFLAFMYFLFYFLFQYFEGEKKKVAFYLPASIFLCLLFTVRYSAIYLFVGLSFFYVVHCFLKKNTSFLRQDFFYFLMLSFCGILLYSFFNYFVFGDFVGENYRNEPYLKSLGEDFFRDILSVFNSFNPILGIKPSGISKINFAVEFFLFLINLFFIFYSIKIWKSYFKKKTFDFHLLCIITGLVYTFLVFATLFFQGIEELNMRMLSESSFCYFYSLIFIYYKEKRNEKSIFLLAVFSLIFNSFYVIKLPENFLARKEIIETKLSEMKDKKYFFIDNKNEVKMHLYKIPILQKEFKYEHQNMQDSYIDGNIIMTKKPRILWILKDTVKNKNEVIYSSKIKQK